MCVRNAELVKYWVVISSLVSWLIVHLSTFIVWPPLGHLLANSKSWFLYPFLSPFGRGVRLDKAEAYDLRSVERKSPKSVHERSSEPSSLLGTLWAYAPQSFQSFFAGNCINSNVWGIIVTFAFMSHLSVRILCVRQLFLSSVNYFCRPSIISLVCWSDMMAIYLTSRNTILVYYRRHVMLL